MPNRLRYFLGKSHQINGLDIYSPTIDSVGEIGEVLYSIYIALATFNKEAILKHMFNVSDEDYERIEHEDNFDTLTLIPAVVLETQDALSYFTKSTVIFNPHSVTYNIGEKVLVSKENYLEFSSIIEKLNGLSEESEEKPKIKFKSESARKMYEELMKQKKKSKNKNSDSLSLKDVLSILCNADGNGINVFNVSNLTIYQVYEHFERLQIKEQHTRLLRVWANGYLGEKDKLPEWIIKSKL